MTNQYVLCGYHDSFVQEALVARCGGKTRQVTGSMNFNAGIYGKVTFVNILGQLAVRQPPYALKLRVAETPGNPFVMQKTPIPPVSSGPGYERIRNALETILASEKFLSAPQMSAFLRYVVVQAATGNKGRIKAYTVAVDALGKPETFDPQNDPVVRVLAGRLRSTLSAYYEQHSDTDVIIEMKPGSYVPTFILREACDQPSDGSDSSDTQEDAAPALEDEPVDSMVQPVNLAQAANNQWASNKAGEPVTDARMLDVSYQQSAAGSTPPDVQPPSENSRNNRLFPLVSNFRRFPKITAAAALLGALMIGMYSDGLMRSSEPVLLASKLSQDTSTQRPRPDSLSLFFSATSPENSLASQVNTTMSSVFSEKENIRVYRMLRPSQIEQFWPEDYHVSLSVVPLLDETQVSVQLVAAQTGRIAHSEILHLSAGAPQGLSSEDLQIIMECSRRLIGEDGPLSRDYKKKISSP